MASAKVSTCRVDSWAPEFTYKVAIAFFEIQALYSDDFVEWFADCLVNDRTHALSNLLPDIIVILVGRVYPGRLSGMRHPGKRLNAVDDGISRVGAGRSRPEPTALIYRIQRGSFVRSEESRPTEVIIAFSIDLPLPVSSARVLGSQGQITCPMLADGAKAGDCYRTGNLAIATKGNGTKKQSGKPRDHTLSTLSITLPGKIASRKPSGNSPLHA